MNNKRASQSARIAELEQHIVKLYMIVEQIINKIKDADTDTKEEREKK
jgi:hypothetical protein